MLLDEFALIRMMTRPPSAQDRARGVAVGIGDDAAVVDVSPGTQLVLSCDTMVENVHFKAETMRDADIGYKAMASNLSDMAAMGARPKYALVAVSASERWASSRLRDVYEGLYACADRYGVAVVGGDTTRSTSGLVLTVTVIGEAETGRALLRSSAKPGDAVFVTGSLGQSAAGLDYLLRRNAPAVGPEDVPDRIAPLVREHQRPEPQLKAGRLLIESGVRCALNDVSDGLASEAWEIAEASGGCLVLDESRIPIDDEVRAYALETGRDPLAWALYGGEDYRLVGTLPAERLADMEERFRRAGLQFYPIGRVGDGPPSVRLRRRDGSEEPVAKRGYNHFG